MSSPATPSSRAAQTPEERACHFTCVRHGIACCAPGVPCAAKADGADAIRDAVNAKLEEAAKLCALEYTRRLAGTSRKPYDRLVRSLKVEPPPQVGRESKPAKSDTDASGEATGWGKCATCGTTRYAAQYEPYPEPCDVAYAPDGCARWTPQTKVTP